MNFQGCSLWLNSQEKEKEGTSKGRSAAAAQAHTLLYGFCERFNFPRQKVKEDRSGLLFGSCRSYKDFQSVNKLSKPSGQREKSFTERDSKWEQPQRQPILYVCYVPGSFLPLQLTPLHLPELCDQPPSHLPTLFLPFSSPHEQSQLENLSCVLWVLSAQNISWLLVI